MLCLRRLTQPDRRANSSFSFTATRVVGNNKSSEEKP
jgi:hypothetical protein